MPGPGAIPAVLHLARQGKYSLPLMSHTPSTWPHDYISLGTGDRPGDTFWYEMGHRVTWISYCLIPLVLHPQWEWLLIIRPVGRWSWPLSTTKDSEPGGTDSHAPGTGRGPRLFSSSLTRVYFLKVHSSPAGGSHILPALLFAFIAGIDKDTPLEPEFLDLFQIYLWVSGTVPYSTFYHLCCSAEVSR